MSDSYFLSKYYPWFVELGYPQLDIVEYEDGEWSIIEMMNYPVIPSLCQWKHIFSGFRNRPPTKSFVKRLIDMIDLQKREAWDRYEQATREAEEKHERTEKARETLASGIAQAVSKNEDLTARVLQNGFDEIQLKTLIKRIPQHKIRDLIGPTVQIFS